METCSQCGETFSSKPRRSRNGDVYCSRPCYGRAWRARRFPSPATHDCHWCGEEYAPSLQSRRRQRFCSILCGRRWHNARAPKTAKAGDVKQCAECGAAFTLDGPRQFKRKYCSEECKRIVGTRRKSQRWYHLSSRYQVTRDEYERLLTSGDFACWICRRPLEGKGLEVDAPQVDHDHVSGDVRGILCRPCNVALGNLQDDPTVLESALAYLRSSGVQDRMAS